MTQSFIPGIDGSQGISSFELSPCKKYLAVCEKAPQAICVVYELKTLKQKRVLTSSEIGATEYVGLSFARSEKDKLQQYLCTLTNRCSDGQFRLVVWLWEKSRLVTAQIVRLDLGGATPDSIPLHCSFHPEDPKILLLTGKNMYRYYKLNSNMQL